MLENFSYTIVARERLWWWLYELQKIEADEYNWVRFIWRKIISRWIRRARDWFTMPDDFRTYKTNKNAIKYLKRFLWIKI